MKPRETLVLDTPSLSGCVASADCRPLGVEEQT